MDASGLVAALEATWSAIQRRHHDVPDVVVTLGAGSIGVPAGALKLGHFAAERWIAYDTMDPVGLAELFVGGEGLRRGAEPVLATLLHEAAHGVAHVRGIKDTSRQGRYHNTRFKLLGEELGLTITQAPTIGWSSTDSLLGPRLSTSRRSRRLRRPSSRSATPKAVRRSGRLAAGTVGRQVKRRWWRFASAEERSRPRLRVLPRPPDPGISRRRRARPDRVRRL